LDNSKHKFFISDFLIQNTKWLEGIRFIYLFLLRM